MIDFGLDTLDDLQQRQEDGVDVKVFDPGTETVLFTVRVAGPDSAQQKRATVRMNEEAAARGANTPLTQEENEQVGFRYLARCTMGWDMRRKDGQEIPWNEDAAYELIKRYPYVKAVIDGAAGSRLRFTKRSQTA